MTAPLASLPVAGAEPIRSSEVRSSGPGSEGDDLALLRRHAPDLVLEAGELFRPTAIEPYVARCEIVLPGGVGVGSVTADGLDERWPVGTSLRFVPPEERRAVGWRAHRRRRHRTSTPRQGVVGLFGRLLGALFQLSMLCRATTPSRTAVAAAIRVTRSGWPDQAVCYGRVVAAGEWKVLHYAYFYVMNDWRTGYGGLNDHEADWEQAWIFCDPVGDRPEWVAATSHDHRGPDLRRHWDDPELVKRDGHPVLFTAGGSHALFFRPGDYVSRIDVPGLRWLLRSRRWVLRALACRDHRSERWPGPAFGVPFVDVARGDGPGLTRWELRPLAGPTWSEHYRGLWGADPGDPLQAERGPAGPKFDRRGGVRASWADPLGFVGLHGTPPPSAVASRLTLDRLDQAVAALDTRVREQGRLLSLARQTFTDDQMAHESRRLTELLRQRCELEGLRPGIEVGRWRSEGMREHLRRPATPLDPGRRAAWLSAGWAAMSIPLVLGMLASVLLLDTVRLPPALVGAVLVIPPIELLARRRLRTALGLGAFEIALVALFAFALGPVADASRYIAGAILLAAGTALLARNGRELSRCRAERTRRRRREPGPWMTRR